MVITLTDFIMASTIFSGLKKLLSFLFSWRALFSLVFILAISAAWASIFACLCLELWDKCFWSPLSTAAVVTIAFVCCFPLAIKHEGQPTPKLCKTLRVRGRQTLSPGHHSEVGVSQILSKLVLQNLVGLTYKFWLLSYNFSNQDLQPVCKSILGLPDLLRLVVKICNQGSDPLA